MSDKDRKDKSLYKLYTYNYILCTENKERKPCCALLLVYFVPYCYYYVMKNKEIQVKQNVNCLQRRKKEMFSSLFLLLCHLRAVGLNEHISRLKYYLHFFLFFYRVNERRNNLVYILKLFFFFVQCPTFYYEKKTVLYIDVKQTTLFSESVNAVLESVL